MFIEVADDGVGMDEATRRRCLEPFFTTKGERGSGLGLAMVYGITQRHGIDIDIESAPGKGTTFRLTFPPQTAAAAADTPRPARADSRARTRILLIDDDPLLLTSLREVLMREGHEVDTRKRWPGGDRCLSRGAEARAGPFPSSSPTSACRISTGEQSRRRSRPPHPALAIIMLTGWGQRLAATGEIPPRSRRVLSKPPRLAELRAETRRNASVTSGNKTVPESAGRPAARS